MYILLTNATGTQILLQLEPGTVVNVYNDADQTPVVAAVAAGAAAGPASYNAETVFPGNKLIYKLNVSDAPQPNNVDAIIAAGATIGNLIIAPTNSIANVADPANPTILGGKKRRYHGKTKKSRR